MYVIETKRLKELNAYHAGNKPLIVTDASDLEFPVGSWPDVLSVVTEGGAGMIFYKSRRIMIAGTEEFCGYVYQTKDGTAEWHVLND